MAAFGVPGGWEIFAILAVVLLLFGPSQLPKLAKTFGKSAKALRDGMNDVTGDDEDEKTTDSAKAAKSEDEDA